MRRTGICGSAETLLVDSAIADTLLPKLAEALQDAGCELRGDEAVPAPCADMKPATEDDWATEYLAPIITVGLSTGLTVRSRTSPYGRPATPKRDHRG
jgi:glutamate-5-semialdehyde dehydrogenase